MSPPRPWRAAAAVGVVALAAQALAVRDVLIWDDIPLLARSDLYTSASHWVESVTTPLGRETFYWRPAATTSFLVESLVHGGAAWGFRLTSAVLHAATSVVAFVLLLRLVRTRTAALLGALAFAVHPVNVETVTWISARFDLLAGLFSLSALAAMPAGAAPRARWAAAAVCALAACCSKESAFLLPILALLWSAAEGGAEERPRLAPFAWTSAGAVAALFLRFEALGWLFRTRAASVADAGGATQHLLLVGRAVATSVGTLVFPWGTVGPAHHAVRPVPPDDALGWAGIAVGAVLVALTAWALRRRRRVGLLLVAFLVSLAPASQIVPLDLAGGLHAADRFVYLPSFFAVAAATLWATECGTARRGAIAAALFVAALAAGRLAVLPRWNDPVAFWSWAVRMAPEADVAQADLAYAQLAAGRFDEAEKHARLAGAIGTSVLAEALVRQGLLDPAQHVLEVAIADRPADAELRVQRGEIELGLARPDAALADFEAAIGAEQAAARAPFAPLLPRALAGAAAALAARSDRVGHARGYAERAETSADARDAVAWLRIARAWIAIGDMPRATTAIARASAAGAPAADVEALRAETRK